MAPDATAVMAPQIALARLPAGRQLDIYRNNIMAALGRALMEMFPVVTTLVGEDFFKALVRTYVPEHPPTSARLNEYSEEFPDFLETFPPAAQLPYLADVARLEWCWNESYHAADAAVLDPASLASLSESQFVAMTFTVHPSLRLVQSDFPVGRIWHTNKNDLDETIDLSAGAEHLLIVRPQREVTVKPISVEAWYLLSALSTGRSLGDALAHMPNPDALNLGECLALFFASGVFTAWHLPEE